MQIERLHERVAVRADFRGGVITPVAVARQSGQRLSVESVSGRWIDRAGGQSGAENQAEKSQPGARRSRRSPCYHFTVQMSGATYELSFDPEGPEWWLERVML